MIQTGQGIQVPSILPSDLIISNQGHRRIRVDFCNTDTLFPITTEPSATRATIQPQSLTKRSADGEKIFNGGAGRTLAILWARFFSAPPLLYPLKEGPKGKGKGGGGVLLRGRVFVEGKQQIVDRGADVADVEGAFKAQRKVTVSPKGLHLTPPSSPQVFRERCPR